MPTQMPLHYKSTVPFLKYSTGTHFSQV